MKSTAILFTVALLALAGWRCCDIEPEPEPVTLPPCGSTDAAWDAWASANLAPGECQWITCPRAEAPRHVCRSAP
jgi:hypothetical protein